jgi:hypothetical protein
MAARGFTSVFLAEQEAQIGGRWSRKETEDSNSKVTKGKRAEGMTSVQNPHTVKKQKKKVRLTVTSSATVKISHVS